MKKNDRNNIFAVKRTILVVDDEEINRAIMSAILAEDFNVLEASDDVNLDNEINQLKEAYTLLEEAYKRYS